MTRGDIYLLDFGIPFGSEPGMCRPVVIIQSDKENLNGLNTKVVIPLTSNTINSTLRGNVFRFRTFKRFSCIGTSDYCR